jgi:predicted RNA-binding protein YlqC (UPF0109 family)
MRQLLTFLLQRIVDHPEEIKVTEETDDTGQIILNVQVHPEDIGRVIGKGGKIINALRQVIKIIAIKQQQRVRINIQD